MEQTGILNVGSLDKAASTAANDPETTKAWNISVTSSQHASFLIIFKEITPNCNVIFEAITETAVLFEMG